MAEPCEICGGLPCWERGGADCLRRRADARFDWRVACALVKVDVTWLDPDRETTEAELEQMCFALGGQLDEAARQLRLAEQRHREVRFAFTDLAKCLNAMSMEAEQDG